MPEPGAAPTARGPGRLLVAVYAVFAIAATARSAYQLVTAYEVAPVPYLLSAVAACTYIAATLGLARGIRPLAWAATSIELVGVVAVGIVSFFDASAFPDQTVWSHLGQGYGYVPLVLPVLGLSWLARTRVR